MRSLVDADERRVDLEGNAVERDRAVSLHTAPLSGEEVVAEVGAGHPHALASVDPGAGG